MTWLNGSTSSFHEQRIEDEVVIAINDDDFGIKAEPSLCQALGQVGAAKPATKNDDSLPPLP